MTKTQKLVLAALRANAYGKVSEAHGIRWTATDATYEAAIDAAEDGTRPISAAQFYDAVRELNIAGQCVLASNEGETTLVQLPPVLKESDMFNVKTATMMQLVQKWNELKPGNLVKRFSDRATAEKRVTAALDGAADSVEANVVRAMKSGANVDTKKAAGNKKAKQALLEGVEKKPRKAPAGSRLAERTVRHHVTVNGTAYRSVADAFRALRLPMGKHIKFRGELKTSPTGKATFADGGKSYNFALVAK